MHKKMHWLINSRRSKRRAFRKRSGIALIYCLIAMTVLAGFVSLAVDYGAAQLVKTQLQATADATAHDYIELYNTGGKSHANSLGPNSYSSTTNSVSLISGAQPTYSVTWGFWNFTTKSFSTSNNGGNTAVKVSASCTRANNNGVPLLFGSVFGQSSVDVHATSIAASVTDSTKTLTIDAQSDIYFSGMPSGTSSTYGDDAIDNPPTQVSGIAVTPGSVMTFINTSGTSSVCPGSMPYVGAAGVTSGSYGLATHHGVSWDGVTGTPGSENGIADAVMPEGSLMGMFLDDNAPNTTSAPATVDWTSAANKDKNSYTNLKLKAPFCIGDGITTGGTVQQFTVPAGATRLFVGMWDGLQFNNNDGSTTVTVTREVKSVQIVK